MDQTQVPKDFYTYPYFEVKYILLFCTLLCLTLEMKTLCNKAFTYMFAYSSMY